METFFDGFSVDFQIKQSKFKQKAQKASRIMEEIDEQIKKFETKFQIVRKQ